MEKIVKYSNFFAYSKKTKKCFNTSFSDGINIVHGKNTSGKSTLLQCILYTFGINDEKRKLEELLSEDVIFRLELTLVGSVAKKVNIIRDGEILLIKINEENSAKFIGVGGNNSREHMKLKAYLSKLFGFNLCLEYEGEYKPASLEAMFLPYYVAQDVGWVYRHKSFRGLDFVKNFKVDFFDYYLGIDDKFNRIEKAKLVSKKKEIETEINLLEKIERKDRDLKLSIMTDELFGNEAAKYIEEFKANKSELIGLEKSYIISCNELTELKERRKILLRVKRDLRKDLVSLNNCPTCQQTLEHTVEEVYNYHQDLNDTSKQIELLNINIKELKDSQGKINSLMNKIEKKKKAVANDYFELKDYNVADFSFESWLKNKVNIELSANIRSKLAQHYFDLSNVVKSLKFFKPDSVISKERNRASDEFKSIFIVHLASLKIKQFDDDRFYRLYEIPAFPRQGVELLKILLAYNFSFLEIIRRNKHIHVLPLILDAIFEGDLEDESREQILDFIAKNNKPDQQIILSIADSRKNIVSPQIYNERYFSDKAKLICIGGNKNTRSLLDESGEEYQDYVNEIFEMLG